MRFGSILILLFGDGVLILFGLLEICFDLGRVV